MIQKIKKVVEEVDVTKLSITELYYYFLLVMELGLTFKEVEKSIITKEDYE